MFIFKKIVSRFLFPVPLILLISLVGLGLLWFTRKQKAGKIFISIGLSLLLLLSYRSLPSLFLWPLENKHAAYIIQPPDGHSETEGTDSIPNKRESRPVVPLGGINRDSPESFSPQKSGRDSIKFVVVLGGGHISDPKIPLTGQINESSLVRLVEGIRIYRKYPGSRLILSGGSGFDPVPNAEIMARIAIDLGVDEDDMVIESTSKDTKDEAVLIKPMVLDDPFVLVTDASHMPRAMGMFKKLGMNPIPAPTSHKNRKRQGLHPGSFFPDACNLRKAERAFYEYMGIVWAKMRGQI